MKPLLIVKTGTTFSSIRQRYGDFDDFILSQLQITAHDAIIAPIFETLWLPKLDIISGVIITGSHSMVTDREEWSEYLAEWLRNIPAGSLPVLGICYGHQLLAHAFGGEVRYHPQGVEIGTVSIQLTQEGRKDPLLGFLPNSFLGHVDHSQTVIKLPDEAKLLAKNDFEPHHAFVIRGNMWGVQFHPEFGAEITRAYIDEQKQELAQAGYDIEQLQKTVQDHIYGMMLLKRFWEIVRYSDQTS
ncbi:glutamine amidotransferase class-I [Desulfotomaculum nigrificans CO-1-SRB]|uniref:Glutamine amidotransferase class-I n=1 Tax=Desulfotomaculum nigrificans (strain DSM 14880 / VKM B-2319 / CO-1-SRB) TaxID=868595 RepID=F6B6A0_DESCC|nr:glutamine amidotransferase [Desulfotomaculum nigrificans]AEF95523.1 glutamine amidotransferase class-I [Desulfotomaculum nigrificans CO-1-SRB]